MELTQIETKVKPKKKPVSTCKSISTHPHTLNPVVPFITLTNHDNDGQTIQKRTQYDTTFNVYLYSDTCTSL